MNRAAIFVLFATALSGQPPNDLATLNRQADLHLAAYDLNRAEPLLEQALTLATRLGPAYEAPACARLAALYLDFRNRDGRAWQNLALPLIIRALDLRSSLPNNLANQLAATLALAIIKLPAGEIKPDLSPPLANFLDRWITQLELTNGPLNPITAVPYQALFYSKADSDGRLRALHACDLFAAYIEPAPPEFSAFLIQCAENEFSESDILPLARKARATATAGGPRYNYELVLSHLLDAEAHSAAGDTSAAVASLATATELAQKSLSPNHDVWDRIAFLGAPFRLTQKELILRPTNKKTDRIESATILTDFGTPSKIKPRGGNSGGTNIVGVLVAPDGTGSVVNSYRIDPSVTDKTIREAIQRWKFQPWTKDGRPVPGFMILEFPSSAIERAKVSSAGVVRDNSKITTASSRPSPKSTVNPTIL